MKTKFYLVALALLGLSSSLRADVVLSNLDSVSLEGDSAVNTMYLWEDTPFAALTFQLGIGADTQLNFESITTYLGWSGAGSESAPTVTLRILDSNNHLVATTLGTTLVTDEEQMYDVNGASDAAPFLVTLATASPVALREGTYTLQIWDTGEQLNYFTAVQGDIVGNGLSLALVDPYSSSLMPALAVNGTVVPAPEPSSILLMAVGLGGALLLGRRRLANIGSAV